MKRGSAKLQRPYGLHRRSTYEEQVQYIKEHNGEFLVHGPDRTSTTIEMMSPYLSAWKTAQQAIIAKKQNQLNYWKGAANGEGASAGGDAPMAMQPEMAGDDFQSMPNTVDEMVVGRSNAVAQHRMEQRDRLDMHLERAARNEEERHATHDEFFIGSDPDLELAEHEGLDVQPLQPPRTGPQPSTETLREAAIHGGRMGALAGAAARGVQLAGKFARGAIGSLSRDALAGELEFATVGGVAGEGLAAAGLTGGVLGAGALPVLAGVAGTLMAGAAIGSLTGIGGGVVNNLEHRLMTSIHRLGDEIGHLGHNAGALEAQERGIDARPAPMAIGWERAAGPDRMVRTQPLAPPSYEHARQQAAGSVLSSATTVSLPGSASTFLPSRHDGSSGRPMRDMPLPNFPGGMSGPRPLTNVERAALYRDASTNPRHARPFHGHGLGRG